MRAPPFGIERLQPIELLADLALESARHRTIPLLRAHIVGKISLSGSVTIGLVVRVTVLVAIAEFLHQPGRRVAQMDRHRARLVLADERPRLIVGVVTGVGLRRGREIENGLRERKLPFGRPKALVCLCRVERDARRARIGQANVLPRHAHDTPRQIARVGAAVEHAAEPVQRAVRRAAAHRLVQGADLVVERIAPLVETTQILGKHAGQQRLVDRLQTLRHCRLRDDLHIVEQLAAVAIGRVDQALTRLVGKADVAQLARRARDHLAELFVVQTLEHIHGRPREQCTVHFERRILRGGAYKDEQPRFHVWQECVLLCLVEAVHLVDEHDRLLALRPLDLRRLDGVANILHPREHRR